MGPRVSVMGLPRKTCQEIYDLGLHSRKTEIVDKHSVHINDNTFVGIVSEELYECVKAGANVCPVGAIRVGKNKGQPCPLGEGDVFTFP